MPDRKPHPRIPEPVSPHSIPQFGYDEIDKIEQIGSGGDADVFHATVDYSGEAYSIAVKQPRFDGTLQQRVLERFQNEAETWSKLDDHDNIVSVYAWDAQPIPWLALEYMDGGVLNARLGEVPIDEALWLAGRIAEGIRHGHRHGVAHLDIKPENILFRETPGDEYPYPKVSDWGVAKLLLDHSKSIAGISPTYAAPEQFDAETYGRTDDITDIYQFGAVCYALCTGRPPFTGSSTAVMQRILEDTPVPPTDRDPDLPDALDEILLTALRKDKEQRYDSIVVMRKALDDLYRDVVESDIPGGTAAVSGGGIQTPTSPESKAGVSTDGEHEDDGMLISRRAAIGLLGTGAIGAGVIGATQYVGVLGGTQSQGSDSPTSSQESGTPPAEQTTATQSSGEETDTGDDGGTSGQEPVWVTEVDTQPKVRFAPVVTAGSAYIPAEDTLFAVDTDSGEIQWEKEEFNVFQPMGVVDDTLVAIRNRDIVAIGTADGTRQWATTVAEGSSYGPVGLTVSDGAVYVAVEWSTASSPRTTVHRLAGGTGEEEWQTEIEGTPPTGVAVTEEVYVPIRPDGEQSSILVAFDTDTGERRWQWPIAPALRNVYSRPYPLSNGQLALLTETYLYGISPAEEESAWETSDDFYYTTPSSIYTNDSTIYVTVTGSREGYHRLEPDSPEGGTTIEIPSTPTGIDGTNDGRIVVATSNGELLETASDGSVRWAYRTRGEMSPPTVADGTVFFTTDTGEIGAIELPNE